MDDSVQFHLFMNLIIGLNNEKYNVWETILKDVLQQDNQKEISIYT
jgi:hypothetical protein